MRQRFHDYVERTGWQRLPMWGKFALPTVFICLLVVVTLLSHYA